MSTPPYRSLTRLAHEAIAGVLTPGSRAIDATMGNGHDTLFLARRVAPDGRVIAFDIQERALRHTRARLAEAGLLAVAELHREGHERLGELIPGDWPGHVSAVMFNLGYLPGGDRDLITRADSTLAALDQSLAVLRPGGLVSVLLYRGHAGADAETEAVTAWLDSLPSGYRLERHDSPGPVLFLIHRLGRG